MAAHFYTLESEIRSISGMIYGLIVSFSILFVPIFKILIKTGKIESFLVFLAVLYCITLYFLLKNFRFMRMKEVNEIFNGTLAYKKELNAIIYCGGIQELYAKTVLSQDTKDGNSDNGRTQEGDY